MFSASSTPYADFLKRVFSICFLICALSAAFLSIETAIQAQPPSHPTDPSKGTEHEAMLALVPVNEATYQAARSGNWSNPLTWRNYAVPPNKFRRGIPADGGKVVIPAGITVLYDVDSDADLTWLRIDGKLRFETGVTTQLRVDTIVVTPSGTWEQGTAKQPIGAGYTSTVTFTDAGPINRSYDPTLLSRGLISHGAATIFGAEKTRFLPVAAWARAGMTQAALTQAPAGWRVGDEVILTGTKFNGYVYEDEELKIASIRGRIVTFDRALRYDHVAPGLDADGNPAVYLTNFTNNIRFQSANTSFASDEAIQRHGHVMLMHSDKISINYASFDSLGRTNKSHYIDDVFQEPSDGGGTMTAGTGTNVRGRYALHIHRTSKDINASPAIVNGCTVRHSPGWGIVNHESYVNVENSAVYDVNGAGFVEETGDGVGAFRRNIAIRMLNSGRNSELRDNHILNDVGWHGIGFFFRGNAVKTEHCISVDARGAGFAWINKYGEYSRGTAAASLPHPGFANNADGLAMLQVPTTDFRDSTVINSDSGVESGYWYVFEVVHGGRHHIENLVAYNIAYTALNIPYTVNVTARNVRATGDHYGDGTRAAMGVYMGGTARGDYVFDNVRVTNFREGLHGNTGGRLLVVSNSDFTTGNTTAFVENGTVQIVPASSINLNAAPTFTQSSNLPVLGENHVRWSGYRASGTVTDSMGQKQLGYENTNDSNMFYTDAGGLRKVLERGYYTNRTDGSKYVVLKHAYMDRVTGQIIPINFRIPVDLDTIRNRMPEVLIGQDLGEFVSELGKPVLRINAGGAASNGFTADSYFSGGDVTSLDSSQFERSAWNAAPSAVYGDVRYGSNFSYTLPGLSPNGRYTVRLHFAESWYAEMNRRIFDVSINNAKVLAHFDVRADAGAINTALVKDFNVAADSGGRIQIKFASAADSPDPNAMVSAIEVLTDQQSLFVQVPVATAASGVYNTAFNIALISNTTGATIHYTTDGSLPTTASPVYTSPIPIRSTMTVNSMAEATGMINSAVSSVAYTIVAPEAPIQINVGGGTVSGFAPDTYLSSSAGPGGGEFSLGYTNATNAEIDTTAPNAAPAAVYKDWAEQKWFGGFSFIVPNLAPNQDYTVRLHFIEPEFSAPNARRFNVWVNGALKLEAFDIYAAAGNAANKAVVIDLPNIRAGITGTIYLRFKNGGFGDIHDNTAIVSGIELIPTGQPRSAPSPPTDMSSMHSMH